MSEGKENPAIITNDTEEGVASLSVTELSTTAEANSVSYEDKNSSPTTTVEMGSFGSKLIKPQRTDESQAVKKSGESGYSSQSGQSRKAENSKSEDVAAKREMYIHMPVEQKREQYLCGKNYVTLSDVPTWVNYKTTSKLESQLPKRKGRRGSLPDANSIVEIYEPCAEINKRISVWRGDITKLEIDCIVNAANNSLLGGGGVDGAIHWAASRLLYHECKTLNGCETGDVKVTAGYKLPARYVVHTVGPIGESRVMLSSCYEKSLEKMLELNQSSIAFPCISTGVYGYPNDRAVEVVLHTTRQFLERLNKRNELSKVDRIVFCLFLDVDVGLYEQRMPFYFPRPTTPSTVETPLNLQSSGAPRGAGSHMPPSHEGKDIRDVASDFDRTKSGSAAGTTAPTTPQSGNVSSLESNSSVDTDSKNLAPAENLPHADGSVARNDNFVRPSTEDTPSEICYQVSDMQIKDESDRLQTNQSSLTDDKNVALGTSDCCRSTVEEAAKDVHAPEQASSGSDVDKPAAGDGPDGTVCGNTPPEQSDQAGGRVESHGSDVLSHL